MNLLDQEKNDRGLYNSSKKGGFFPLPKSEQCRHPEHKPPTHIHIPQGQGYRHICPGCGNVVDIIPPQVTL
jgi:hypothetical protein